MGRAPTAANLSNVRFLEASDGASIHVCSGIVTVMQALVVYRQARVHALGHFPKDFLNKEKDSAWLKL